MKTLMFAAGLLSALWLGGCEPKEVGTEAPPADTTLGEVREDAAALAQSTGAALKEGAAELKEGVQDASAMAKAAGAELKEAGGEIKDAVGKEKDKQAAPRPTN